MGYGNGRPIRIGDAVEALRVGDTVIDPPAPCVVTSVEVDRGALRANLSCTGGALAGCILANMEAGSFRPLPDALDAWRGVV